jgi:hypothetical protein
MNKLVCTLVTASVLVSGSAFGQSKNTAASDKPSKQSLLDNQMDGVTAGSALAVGDAAVTSNDAASVKLGGGALSGAAGINIVNSSNSLDANGVNVYDSSIQGRQGSGAGSNVNQQNSISQTEGTNAKIAVEASDLQDEIFAAEAAAKATNIAADSAKATTNTNDSVDLTGNAEQAAKGLNIVNSAGGLVANGLNIAHSSNVGAVPTLTQTNDLTQKDLAAGSGSGIAIDSAAVATTNTGAVNLSGGALSDAAGINIVNSTDSAVANGVNVYDSSLTNQASNSGSSVTQNNTIDQNEKTNATVQVAAAIAPLDLQFAATAQATNIAADSAKINNNSNYSVDLAGTAEQNATALNLVNSAGSIVSNGINIAHSTNIGSIPTLNQVNSISQVR